MSFASLCEILMSNYIPLISVSKFPDKSEGIMLKEVLSKLPNQLDCIVSQSWFRGWSGFPMAVQKAGFWT